MSGFSLREWIGCPPDQVFAFATDPASATKVSPSVVAFEVIGGGPMRPGARIRETRRIKGREHTTDLEITAFDPPTALEVRTRSMGVEVRYRYAFAPEGEGTAVDLVCDVRARGIRKMVAFTLGKILAKEDGDHLARLKEAMTARGTEANGVP